MSINPSHSYLISSSINADFDVTLAPRELDSTKAAVIGAANATLKFLWRFTPGGSNVYTIALANNPQKHLFVENGKLWLSTNASTKFTREPAGSAGGRDVYRLKVSEGSFVGQVLHLQQDNDQFTVAKQDDTLNEKLYFDEFFV